MRVRRSETLTEGPVPPPELGQRCHVEDWLARAEVAELDCDQALTVAAGRWRNARHRWLDEHGVPWTVECKVIPFRSPQWRNRP